MNRRLSAWLRAAVLVLCAGAGVPLQAQEPAASAPGATAAPAEPALATSLGEFVTRVPAGGFTEPALEVTVFKPAGDGPFPIAVINHGRALGNAHLQPRYRPLLAAREFVQRGYAVVVPMRQGFSKSGGNEIGAGCHIGSNGELQAISVRRTLDWLGTQPWADVSRNIVMGQSHGGLSTLAYGMQPHPGTRLLVNFAGGLRKSSCLGWERSMVSAFAAYGADAKLPSIWFYGDNDSYFPPALFQEAHQRYVDSGGRAELVAYGSFGSDAHAMFGSRAGLAVWVPRVMSAIAAAGLPVDKQQLISPPGDIDSPQASGFAALDDPDKLPTRSERARQGYLAWLKAPPPKAFALHAGNGSWASAAESLRPLGRALEACARFAKQACRLYAVDDTVVWSPE
ncbi:dienelactone hydrolase family protein [Aquabacterium sp.]|uniref:dienelactone hydrolase family protein n=1 Tax=Aquabacterium sp. TaxID=1872578 RepID=UPI002CB91F37|nr:CocE/NonD family hydrolase [Aquabacterium sp.]HSW05453.1 CocE/NonD family hydrolase [Aquabacterium sp.]